MRHRCFSVFAVLLPISFLSLLAAACKKEVPLPPPPPQRVESAQIGVVLAALPASYAVTVEPDGRMTLVPEGAVDRVIEVSATEPESGGINLIAASADYKAEVEAGGGVNFGRDPAELVSPIGTAFYSRARLSEEGKDQMVIFAVHPWDDRKLKLTSTYPSTDDREASGAYLDELMEVLGEVEALPASS